MEITGKNSAEIYDSVRLLAQSGRFRPGQLLPPVRSLAMELGVNRNTVAAAYKRLVATGIALAHGRLGTVIREQQTQGEQEGSLLGTPLTDLASGNPNPVWLPDIRDAVARSFYHPRLYGEATVNPKLDAYGRQWLEGDCPEAFEIDLAHGAVDAVERLLTANLVAGDKVAVETPCFLSSISTLRVGGWEAVGVPVDSEGMRVESLEKVLSAGGAQAVILTPRAHNPTGFSLSPARAEALRCVLAQHPHVLVIVDDHFALLAETAYHSVIPAEARRWALVRSVSKVLGPDLRVAFVASDHQTSLRLRLRLASGTTWVSHLLQDIVGVCLTCETLSSRVAQARRDYRRRRAWLEAALADHKIPVATPADGLNLWVPLRQDSQPVVFALAKHGWLVRNGEAFSVREVIPGLRITISNLEEVDSRRLAQDIRHSLRGS